MMFEDKEEERRRPPQEDEDQEVYLHSDDEESASGSTAARTFLQAEKGPSTLTAPAKAEKKASAKSKARAASPLSYEEARHLALMKIGYIKVVLGLLLANAVLFGLSWYQVGFSGRTWFLWPAILSGTWLLLRGVKVFAFRGRDLRGVMDSLVDRMTESEIARSDFDSRF